MLSPDQTPVEAQPSRWHVPPRANALILSGVLAISTAAESLFGDTTRAQAAPTPIIVAPVDPNTLGNYITGGVQAWEAYVAPDGQLVDPLAPTSGDGYGVGSIMMADVMLQTAARDGDETLQQNAEHIIGETASLNPVSGTFNLLAIDTLLRDGQEGKFSAQAWAQLDSPVSALAARIQSTEDQHGCLDEPKCYSNWRLVWSAGASALLASGINGDPGTDDSSPRVVANQINTDLGMAVTHAGAPVKASVSGGQARELSDPLSEPPSYHVFSSIMLELIVQQDPGAITPAVERLREAVDRYSLDLMAPDGQLSMAGRSLDQSWVEAAATDLGARRASEDPAHAAEWRSFADRAFSYLAAAYPARPDGLIPIVPGLNDNGNTNIMDEYAHENQYGALTLWFLNDALKHWPSPDAARGPIPADHPNLLVNDLHSSALAWGRSGDVWWDISGRRTDSDPRYAQGAVAVKIDTPTGWRDLLALRPIQTDLSSAWTLTMPGGETATPSFTSLQGNGHHVKLNGEYREADGKVVAPAVWNLTTNQQGIKLDMTKPRKDKLHTTVWLPDQSEPLSARRAHSQQQACVVTASGQACPITLRWARGNNAQLEIGN